MQIESFPQFKFRAWDFDMKEMVDVHKIQFQPHAPHKRPCIVDQHNDILDLEDVFLLQCIGKPDKNRKLIYVGDILQYHEHPGYLMPSVKLLVVYCDDGLGFGYIREDKLLTMIPTLFSVHHELQDDLLNHCEIIGNAFETTSLFVESFLFDKELKK